MEQQEKYLVLIHRYITNQLSAIEEQEFSNWLEQDATHRQLLEDISATWNAGKSYKEAYTPDTVAGLKKLRQRINGLDNNNGVVVLSPTKNRWWLRAAAVLLLVSGLLWMVRNTEKTPRMLTVHSTTTPVVKLADGSIVTLNENTTFSYPEKFTGEERIVKLEGEAFFDVTNDKQQPFKVKTANTSVQVLGTSFNVDAYKADASTEVTVKTGKVKFLTNTGKSLILEATDKGVFSHLNEKLLKSKDTKLNTLFWKTGKLNFDATPMKQVLMDLEKYFKVEIDDQALSISDCPYSGDIIRGDKLEDTFEILESLYGVKVKTLDDGKYRIAAGKCTQ